MERDVERGLGQGRCLACNEACSSDPSVTVEGRGKREVSGGGKEREKKKKERERTGYNEDVIKEKKKEGGEAGVRRAVRFAA